MTEDAGDGTRASARGTLDHVPDILVATDSSRVFDGVRSVLGTAGTTLRCVRTGEAVRAELDRQKADLAVLDLQIGTMGGIAVALDIRLEQNAGRLEACPVLLLLDRRPDVFLARRCGVEGWVLKPIDPIRLRKAATALLRGGTWYDTTYLPDPVAAPPALLSGLAARASDPGALGGPEGAGPPVPARTAGV